MNWNCVQRGKNSLYRADWAAGKIQYLVYGHDKPNQPNKEGPLSHVCTLWVPINLSFSSQQGAHLSSLSGCTIHVYKVSICLMGAETGTNPPGNHFSPTEKWILWWKWWPGPPSTQSSHPPTFPESVEGQWIEIEIESGRRQVEEWKTDE
jgi:hypothetical protein